MYSNVCYSVNYCKDLILCDFCIAIEVLLPQENLRWRLKDFGLKERQKLVGFGLGSS
jgi:hypothetical protein